MLTHQFNTPLHRKFVELELVQDGVYTPNVGPLLLSSLFDDMPEELSLVRYCPGLDEICELPEGLSIEQMGQLRSMSSRVKQLHDLLSDETRTITMVTSFELHKPDPEPVEESE